jgi:hypothetical protein
MACTPLSPGGSEIRPYQQPSSHIRLAKHTRYHDSERVAFIDFFRPGKVKANAVQPG